MLLLLLFSVGVSPMDALRRFVSPDRSHQHQQPLVESEDDYVHHHHHDDAPFSARTTRSSSLFKNDDRTLSRDTLFQRIEQQPKHYYFRTLGSYVDCSVGEGRNGCTRWMLWALYKNEEDYNKNATQEAENCGDNVAGIYRTELHSFLEETQFLWKTWEMSITAQVSLEYMTRDTCFDVSTNSMDDDVIYTDDYDGDSNTRINHEEPPIIYAGVSPQRGKAAGTIQMGLYQDSKCVVPLNDTERQQKQQRNYDWYCRDIWLSGDGYFKVGNYKFDFDSDYEHLSTIWDNSQDYSLAGLNKLLRSIESCNPCSSEIDARDDMYRTVNWCSTLYLVSQSCDVDSWCYADAIGKRTVLSAYGKFDPENESLTDDMVLGPDWSPVAPPDGMVVTAPYASYFYTFPPHEVVPYVPPPPPPSPFHVPLVVVVEVENRNPVLVLAMVSLIVAGALYIGGRRRNDTTEYTNIIDHDVEQTVAEIELTAVVDEEASFQEFSPADADDKAREDEDDGASEDE